MESAQESQIESGQIALVEWPENTAVSDRPPSEYFPRSRANLPPDEWEKQVFWHALPEGWTAMPYAKFLSARRHLMAQVIKAGFETLERVQGSPAEHPTIPAKPPESGVAARPRLLG